MESKADVTLNYNASGHAHAVSSTSSGWTYQYDANGNMTSRGNGTLSFTLTYDGENRLTNVSGSAGATFVYDGDGQRVKGTAAGVTTYYIGNYFEWTGWRPLPCPLPGGERGFRPIAVS